jgi:demethylmenaquinone methyltransferase/2-methoxy-6-polyprenyl-1,4-benzoquinol methylase
MKETTRGHEVTGAAPAGASDEKSAAVAVQQMFDEIASRYDLLNHVLSANVDRLWWLRTARKFRHILSQPNAAVLDLCCGTGDMALALRRQAPNAARPYVGADFSHQMLRRGAAKFHGSGIIAIEADALHLPLPDSSFDLIVSAFGFRNLANYEAGLREIHRVLRPGGEFGILDFAEPGGLFGKVYAFYFRNILPKIGGLISGKSGAYEYLPASVKRFPSPQKMKEEISAVGFTDVSWTKYTFGIAGLYRGRKSMSDIR